MKRGIAFAVVALCAIAGAPSLSWAAEPAPKPALAPAVTVTRAVEREVIERAIVTGTLVPREEILVAPEIEGLRITEVLVEEGDVVEKGEVLARLSRDLLEAQLAQNQAAIARADAAISQAGSNIIQAEAAQLEAAQALERVRSLMKGGNATEAVLEQRISASRGAEGRLAAARDALQMAHAERRSAEAQGREFQVRLDRTEIKAPQAGIVSRKNARIGATASAAGDPLFRIIANGEIELEGEVTETQLVRIREGAVATVTIDSGRLVDGTVRNVFPEVDRATRLGRVRIALPKDAALRIGAFTRGDVELARRTGIAVPLSSVIYDLKGASVQIVENDRVQTRRVRPGLAAEGFVQIEEGVKDGEAVVTRAGSFLRDGDVVRPVVVATVQAEGVR